MVGLAVRKRADEPGRVYWYIAGQHSGDGFRPNKLAGHPGRAHRGQRVEVVAGRGVLDVGQVREDPVRLGLGLRDEAVDNADCGVGPQVAGDRADRTGYNAAGHGARGGRGLLNRGPPLVRLSQDEVHDAFGVPQDRHTVDDLAKVGAELLLDGPRLAGPAGHQRVDGPGLRRDEPVVEEVILGLQGPV